MRTFFLNITLFFLFTSFLIAQKTKLRFEYVALEDGLSNNAVQCIIQDHKGFMWFGTSDGLNRWDGYTIKTFTHDPYESNSISDNYITALCEDSSGLIWIGTSIGLNIYHPKTENFTHYLQNDNNPNSISNNYTFAIFEDSCGNIWIGTGYGLNRYNRESDSFIRYYFPGQLDSVSGAWDNNTIRAINESKDGKLLLGTLNDFLLFDTQTEETSIVPCMIPEMKRWPPVNTIYKDRFRKLWLAFADQGMAKYHSDTGLIRFYKPEPNNPNTIDIDAIPTAFCDDNSGDLWIGTANRGIYLYNRHSKHFTNIKPVHNDESKINSDAISCIYKNEQGNIWIGTEDNGINVMLKWEKPFRHYVHDPQDSNSFAAGEVSNFYEDKNSIVWITNLRGGVSLFDRNSGNFKHITHDPQNPGSLSEGMIYAVCEDKYGNIWFATAPDITCLERKTGTFKHYRYNQANPESHAYTHTLCCYKDQQGTMWFGTANAGLERFNRADETFDHFRYDPADSNSISDNAIFSLEQDKSGNFWIGTQNGLCQMIYDSNGKEKFICYRQHPVDPVQNHGNVILATYEDRTGRFWVVTDAGLSIFDRNKKSFRTIIKGEDLPSSFIWGILEDDQRITEGRAGNLWLRTLRGIFKFNPETGKVRIYDEHNGLKYCRSIKSGYAAFYKGKNGVIYSGGINCFTTFHPDSLVDNPDPPKIVFTDFKINYNTVTIGTSSPLKESITTVDTIQLDYRQNNISFEFAALNFTAPANNVYAYKMENVNPDWIYTSASQRTASYTNLNPGEYIFIVKGSNNDGIWNEEGTSVKIIITPPWWKTNLAYIFYFLFFIFLLYTLRQYDLKRQRLKHQLALEHEQAEKLQEIDHLKSRFFANISHEFRTPLTLIIGPIEQMLVGKFKGNLQEQYQMILRNSRRLLRLVNQLLDLSKLESGGMTLQLRKENIVQMLRSYVQSFESLARQKNIILNFIAENESISASVDREKVEKIVYNLLSNAFKFTPEGGTVNVDISVESTPESSQGKKVNPSDSGGASKASGQLPGADRMAGYLNILISVSNTGSYIPPEKIDRIFDRFYQADDSVDPVYEGTGIGLALVKELVELHHGSIMAESEIDMGTKFSVSLPFDQNNLMEQEINDSAMLPSYQIRDELLIETGTGQADSSTVKKDLPLVMIVEDNPDVRYYLRSQLESSFGIIEASNGTEGIKYALEKMPDIIISDVMMPKMDGYTFCEKIKTDEHTSHIPVILLTARADIQSKITGLETGADDYVSKPFEIKELMTRTKNLIEQRRKLQERFRREVKLKPLEMAFNVTDEKFLQRLVTIIENDITNPRFVVDTFVHELGMSRAQLYRKLQALCGQSVKEFVRTVRLKQAALLLQQTGTTIAEVAYRVGFNNPSYFSECFRKQFGLLPSQYNNPDKH